MTCNEFRFYSKYNGKPLKNLGRKLALCDLVLKITMVAMRRMNWKRTKWKQRPVKKPLQLPR